MTTQYIRYPDTGLSGATIGTFDGGTPSATGASISGDTIFFQSASTTNPGMVNNATQNFSGQKNFGTASASTSATGSAFPVGITNTNATNNNWANLYWSDTQAGPATAWVGVQFQDRTTHVGQMQLWTRGNAGFKAAVTIDVNQNVIVGIPSLATNATAGFLYLPSCAGTPTGTPSTVTGQNPIVYDTTANKLWVYNGSWRGIVLI